MQTKGTLGIIVLWALDEEEFDESQEIVEHAPIPDNTVGTNEEPLPLSLSLSSMVGLSTPHSLKIRGKIRDRDVVVLIDSGGSHNFISTALVEELGLPMVSIKEFGGILGIRAEIRAIGVCRQIKLYLTKLEIVADLFPIPLALRGDSRISVASIFGEVLHELGVNDDEIQSGWYKGAPPRGSLFVQDQVSLRSMVLTI